MIKVLQALEHFCRQNNIRTDSMSVTVKADKETAMKLRYYMMRDFDLATHTYNSDDPIDSIRIAGILVKIERDPMSDI